jgi:curved DNA-binding protein CbpA
MSTKASLLDKLKVKPIPKKKEDVSIEIKIIDKTKDKLVDRQAFLTRISSALKTQQKPTAKDVSVSTAKDVSVSTAKDVSLDTAKDMDAKLDVIEEVETLEPPESTPLKKKTSKKVKITEEPVGIDVDESAPTQEVIPRKRLTKKPSTTVIAEGPMTMVQIGDTKTVDRLPKKKKDVIRASAYYLNNREIFVNFINTLFAKYKDELKDTSEQISCSNKRSEEFRIMTHQKIVRDYLSIYTPYRGLLLYHGLGSGKTCSSIAIAEGLKSNKQVIVMTPASLRRNYIEELKSCGDHIYKKNQYWEFVEIGSNEQIKSELSRILNLSEDYIRKQGGAWLVNVNKPSNYEDLDSTYKTNIDNQINEMIRHKYQFINYNGLRMSHLRDLTLNYKINPFDNKVVVIDEAHNFVSRIVNKMKKPESLSYKMYSYLMSASNVKIVLLTGTPMINYPNELGILFNILRGYIKTWNFPLNVQTNKKITKETLSEMFGGLTMMDQIEYKPSLKILSITRNPFGFVNKNKGDKYIGVAQASVDDRGNVSDEDFERIVASILKKNDIEILTSGIKIDLFKALPDTMDDFSTYFIDANGNIKNENMFKRRILGLASYFRSAQEQLMPRFNKSVDLQVLKIPMSDYQFGLYEKERVEERKLEKQNKKKKALQPVGDLYEESSSTYRIFSRAACNFVFPENMKRPKPAESKSLKEFSLSLNEDMIDGARMEERLESPDGIYEADDFNYYKQLGIANKSSVGEIKDAFKKLSQEYNPSAASNEDERYILERKFKEIQDAYEYLMDAGNKETYDKYLSMKSSSDGVDVDFSYEALIKNAIGELEENSASYFSPQELQKYSPKFLTMLENIQDPEHIGCHLVYSQFRTLEGIGVFKLVLEANGFAQFRIKKDTSGTWTLDRREADLGKPMFVLYTGTEDPEQKEIIRNIFNSNWVNVPDSIVRVLQQISSNNFMGEIIKVFMITASGAEGISLRNVRYVHITEPYWHPVRTEQVIGRARRICSHEDLPEDLRTVQVYLYVMTLTEKQKTSEEALELRLKDRSKIDSQMPITTDENLYEISTLKEEIARKLLNAVKEASIDCSIHSTSGEKIKCFSFGKPKPSIFSYMPSISAEESDQVSQANVKTITWKADKVKIEGKTYAINKKTMEVYDIDDFEAAQELGAESLLPIGKLIPEGKKFKFEKIKL